MGKQSHAPVASSNAAPNVVSATPKASTNILAQLRAPKIFKPVQGLITAALVAAGLSSLKMPRAEAQEAGRGYASNGKPIVEGEFFAPYENRTIDPQVKFFDALHWRLREFARTNTVPFIDQSGQCVGQILPIELQETVRDLLEFRRSQHGLTNKLFLNLPIDGNLPMDGLFNQQDIADTAVYLSRLGMITHFPALQTNAPHYSCLTEKIKRVAATSLLAQMQSSTFTRYIPYFYPAQVIDQFLTDTIDETGHRIAALHPDVKWMAVGSTSMDYSRIQLMRSYTPISFLGSSDSPNVYIVSLFRNPVRTGPDSEQEDLTIPAIVYPIAGQTLSTWGPSQIPASGTPLQGTMLVSYYDFELAPSRLKVTVENESLGTPPVQRPIKRVGRDDGGRKLSFLSYDFGPYNTSSNRITTLKISVSGLYRRGDTNLLSPYTISYRHEVVPSSPVRLTIESQGRYQILPSSSVRLDDERQGQIVRVKIPAALFYEGWVIFNRFAKYSPTQLECSTTPDFTSLVDISTLSAPTIEYTHQGECIVTFKNVQTQLYFRLVKKPGGFFAEQR